MALTLVSLPTSSASGYAVTPGKFKPTSTFTVTYKGSGAVATVYHAEPPNEGGKPDVIDANDSSVQQWSLRYSTAVTIPACVPTPPKGDRCRGIRGPLRATGSSTEVGRIDHIRVDGLFPAYDAAEKCTVRSPAPLAGPQIAILQVVYVPRRRAVRITALSPVSFAVSVIPPACPGRGDPLEGLFDNYFTPGFSFVGDYGPDRWFRSATVTVPVATLQRSARVRIPLAITRAGRAPKDCRVKHPEYERCTTRGTWRGVLTLTRR